MLKKIILLIVESQRTIDFMFLNTIVFFFVCNNINVFKTIGKSWNDVNNKLFSFVGHCIVLHWVLLFLQIVHFTWIN